MFLEIPQNSQEITIKKRGSGLRPATLLKKRLWYRCFPVNFVKFPRTPFLQNTSERLLLNVGYLSKSISWNYFMFHEMTLKLFFMKYHERKISPCILPLKPIYSGESMCSKKKEDKVSVYISQSATFYKFLWRKRSHWVKVLPNFLLWNFCGNIVKSTIFAELSSNRRPEADLRLLQHPRWSVLW